MMLPSSVAGATTQTAGYFACETLLFARWLSESLREHERGWTVLPQPGWNNLTDVTDALTPVSELTRFACLPLDGWTVVLNNGKGGTDLGVVPSLAARQLHCRSVRAVCVADDEPEYPARIVEVYGPAGEPPLLAERSITAANDGGKWVFEAYGDPFPFEDKSSYSKRRKADRFTAEMLREYLLSLQVPVDLDPTWHEAVLVCRPR